MFAMTTLFSFVTLPVEINASARAIEWLDFSGITDFETTPMLGSLHLRNRSHRLTRHTPLLHRNSEQQKKLR